MRATLLAKALSAFVLVSVAANAADDKIRIRVAKHIVSGSGVTAQQMEDWFNQMNSDWACSFVFEQVGAPDTVEAVGQGKVAGAINIYGSGLTASPPGNPGLCYDQDYIELGAGAPNSSAGHEFGHWVEARPDNTASDHGTTTGTYPGYSGYSGFDTDGDGDHDDDDRNNIMYPGTARTGSQTDDAQQARARENARTWLASVGAIGTDRGRDVPDAVGDGGCPFGDLRQCRFWAWEQPDRSFVMMGTILVSNFSATDPEFLGFYLESDRDDKTGMPPEGLDYYVGYDVLAGEPVFRRYDAEWVSLDVSGVRTSYANMSYDAPYDPVPIGINFAFALSLLERRSGDVLSFRTAAEHGGLGSAFYDFSPDSGLLTIYAVPALTSQDWMLYR